jgi:presenilin-like A22 family membrane protease
MKHTLKVTLLLIALFFAAQIIGLFTINNYLKVETRADGTVAIIHQETVVGEPPELAQQEKSLNFILVMGAVLFGTAVLLLLIKFGMHLVWKLWFFVAIAVTLSVSFDVYTGRWVALALGVTLAAIRAIRPNVIVHNLTEIFVYTGITIVLLPWLNLTSGILLLLLISAYDMIAVWKSKHMVKLAKFQLDSKLFAGLSLEYDGAKKSPRSGSGRKASAYEKPRTAILGGGDIAFPLIFAAAVMEHLILVEGVPKIHSFFLSLLVPLGAGISLSLLLLYSKKEKFYPAMPFISIGCILGYLVILVF